MVKQRINAKDIQITIGSTIVGGAEDMTVTVERENSVAREAGTYLPVEIVDGGFSISGTINRAFIDVDLLNEIMPNQALAPSFNIVGKIISGKTPARTITVIGAKFKKVDINGLALTEYAKNALEFDALNWKFEK